MIVQVTIGVDTHQGSDTAAVIGLVEQVLGTMHRRSSTIQHAPTFNNRSEH